MISVRRSAGSSRGSRGSTPSSRLRSRASRMARNLRLIESLWRYGIGGDLARFGCNLTRSAYLTVRREGHDRLGELRTLVRWYLLEYNRPRTMALSPRLYDPRVSVRFRVAHRLQNAGRNIEECRTLGLRLQGSS